jgi:DNA-binding IscR family transcriptional regulator
MTPEMLATQTKTSLGLVRHALESLLDTRMVKPVGEGYRLGFHPRAIYIGDILDATDALEHSPSCPLASPACEPNNPCALCWTLVEADLAAMEVMRRQTLDDLRRTPHRGEVAIARSA